MNHVRLIAAGCVTVALIMVTHADTAVHRLWSDKPVTVSEAAAKDLRKLDTIWSKEIYPIGNGRLGCTVFGTTVVERIQFNEDSLWVGNEHRTGGYQPFGDLYVQFGHQNVTDYRRELDLSRAVQTIRYRSGGVTYMREYFTSYPDQVIVMRFSADKPGSLSGDLWLDSLHRSQFAVAQGHAKEAMDAIITRAEGNMLTLKGDSKDLFWWPKFLAKGLRGREYADDEIINLTYEAGVRVLNQGGKISTQGDRIVFEKCNELVLLLAAETDYVNQRAKGWKGQNPHKTIRRQLAAASVKSFERLLQDHLTDYRSLYDRFAISLGEVDPLKRAMPTADRVLAYEPSNDGDLEALLYHYARYLMISSSRPGHGGLPANLQGLWLFHMRPAWLCDYHTDINLQMNYWFVDQANLGECFVPLAEWIDSIRDVRKEETRKTLGVKRGWLMRSENNLFGGSTYSFQKGDSAWICNNLWDHYAFTRDQGYLKHYAYPVMKEISHFWLDHLKELPDGTLVVPDGTSPEHGPKLNEKTGKVEIVEGHRTQIDGVSYDQQMCWDLFSNTIDAAKALGVDEDLRKELTAKRAKLLGPKIGKWGQLQEWMEDIDDPRSQHRHVSHMLAVFPGHQIHPSTTPRFSEAAKVSMKARGNGKTGWSKIFKACVYARLYEAEISHELIADVLKTRTHGNLWTTHPPFQIDANFGFAAAVNEMLAQSHMGYIQLLPALPKAWSKGSVKGMRLRGGYEIDMKWSDGSLSTVLLRNISGDGVCKIRYDNIHKEVIIPKGEELMLAADAF